MVNGISNYNEWITSLNNRGIKTTRLGNGEANFADYTNALSDSLKQEIAASFDTEADYDLQSKLASLLNGKNLMQSSDMKNILSGTGISYSVQYVKTSYIVDNKADGHYDKDVTNGAIAVYTFKDANGGEIKIADANGNGALESEELFMNEILSGIVSDISASSAGGKNAAGAGITESVQNNNDEQLKLLMAQFNAQMEEQSEFLKQQAKALEATELKPETKKEDDDKKAEDKKDKETKEAAAKENAKEDENKINEDDIKTEAKSLINKMDLKLSTNELAEILDDIVEMVLNDGIDVEKAAKEAVEEFQKQAA